MGQRGPIPKRSEDRQRRNRPEGASGITKGEMRPVEIPNPKNDWHPIAKRLYASLFTSGQADFYQNSDIAYAWSVCDDLSRYKRAEDAHEKAVKLANKWYSLTPAEREEQGMGDHPPHVPRAGSAMKMNAIYAALPNLMVTEADRRRLRIELQAPAEGTVDADVIVMDEYRRGLGLA